ncbi:uncharacterized protein LOC134561464 [Prinia subflava]|uniref:uncharacterized protein LOC134561464 n=1 Tax=Prinia subflava TaxID=208062 RepID=UPI002FDFD91D
MEVRQGSRGRRDDLQKIRSLQKKPRDPPKNPRDPPKNLQKTQPEGMEESREVAAGEGEAQALPPALGMATGTIQSQGQGKGSFPGMEVRQSSRGRRDDLQKTLSLQKNPRDPPKNAARGDGGEQGGGSRGRRSSGSASCSGDGHRDNPEPGTIQSQLQGKGSFPGVEVRQGSRGRRDDLQKTLSLQKNPRDPPKNAARGDGGEQGGGSRGRRRRDDLQKTLSLQKIQEILQKTSKKRSPSLQQRLLCRTCSHRRAKPQGKSGIIRGLPCLVLGHGTAGLIPARIQDLLCPELLHSQPPTAFGAWLEPPPGSLRASLEAARLRGAAPQEKRAKIPLGRAGGGRAVMLRGAAPQECRKKGKNPSGEGRSWESCEVEGGCTPRAQKKGQKCPGAGRAAKILLPRVSP